MRLNSTHATYANVVATLALVLALSGTAVAASTLVGSRQIRDGSIRSADIGNAEVGAVDIGTGAVRSVDVLDNGLRAQDIQDGTLTLADLGRNQRVRALQPGETLTGVVGGRFQATAAGDVATATASFTFRAPVVLNDADLVLDGSAADTRICNGTAADPTGGAGRVCLYPLPGANAQAITLRPAGSAGFLVDWQAAAPGASSVAGVWSYKAT